MYDPVQTWMVCKNDILGAHCDKFPNLFQGMITSVRTSPVRRAIPSKADKK
ncbi:hypothetical protein LX87_02689 [Larkinella arboricola]|uniref:Uncharacterized protein n=1 Tax=Larkinella arboricola TaxID=643671 RepID=A0A327X0H4_LARAB|nr:hypothetical protein LX87_02689 [Larkinella arboricola]